ncbi:MAG: response regulator transcription factor [Pseudomonadota bacterium]|nr:MAG: DNA-binding response regulator [Pseudomonadota bacterium]
MRVLVVDDHDEVLTLVERALVRDGHTVLTAPSAESALEVLEHGPVEIVVLDLGLPGASGEELCRTLRQRGDLPAILILTAENAVASRVRCLDAGADDYLGKPFAVAELRARVRALARRARVARPSLYRKGAIELDFGARRAFVAGREAPITTREWAILEVLAAENGRVVPRRDLLDRIWKDNDPAAAASLEVLIGRIRKKLGVDVVRTVRGEGYALADD